MRSEFALALYVLVPWVIVVGVLVLHRRRSKARRRDGDGA